MHGAWRVVFFYTYDVSTAPASILLCHQRRRYVPRVSTAIVFLIISASKWFLICCVPQVRYSDVANIPILPRLPVVEDRDSSEIITVGMQRTVVLCPMTVMRDCCPWFPEHC